MCLCPEKKTIDMTQRSSAKSRYRLKRPVNEWAGHLCTFTRKQANVWSFWFIYVGNNPQQRPETCLRIDSEFKMAAKQNEN